MTVNEKSMQTIEAMDLQEINNAFDVLKAKLLPYTKEITKDEKSGMVKMSDKSYAFVEKAYERSVQHPEFVPNLVDFDHHTELMAQMEQMRILEARLMEFCKATHDTLTRISSGVYENSLDIYKNVKLAKKKKMPGAQLVYEELKVRFEKQGKRSSKKDSTSVELK